MFLLAHTVLMKMCDPHTGKLEIVRAYRDIHLRRVVDYLDGLRDVAD